MVVCGYDIEEKFYYGLNSKYCSDFIGFSYDLYK